MSASRVALVFSLAILAGCGHTEMHDLVLRPPAPPSATLPELYFDNASPPTRPFYEVALLQAMGYGAEANIDDLAQSLAERGRILGCDAIVRIHIYQGVSKSHGYGVCVRYSPTAAPAVPSPAGVPASPAPPTVIETPSEAGGDAP
jgi:hypothetical protein